MSRHARRPHLHRRLHRTSPYADGLLGATQSTQLTNVFFVDQRLWMASGFFEDDWKVTPRLTSIWAFATTSPRRAVEGKNRMANFNPAGSGSLNFAKSGSLEDRALVNPNYTNFGPRFGVSYYASIDKTVLRGGYGIYYTLFERIGSEDQLALNPPFLINKTIASNNAPVLVPEVGFPSNFLDPSTINLNQLQAFHVRAVNPAINVPTVQQWSVGVQHQFASAGWLKQTTSALIPTTSTYCATTTRCSFQETRWQPVRARPAVQCPMRTSDKWSTWTRSASETTTAFRPA